MRINRSIMRRVFATLLVASTVNGGLAHAAMVSVLSGSSPNAVYEPAKHDRHYDVCVAGSNRLPCPLCSQSCSAGAAIVADAGALLEVATPEQGPVSVAGVSGVLSNRNNPIRAPPQPLFQG